MMLMHNLARTRLFPPKPKPDVAAGRRHLIVVWVDDVSPMEWSQPTFAKYAPALGEADIARQRLYARTPFLNYLASQGMIYSRAFTAPVCSPGRVSLQTGELPCTHGVGAVINLDNTGDLDQARDAGFDSGTPLATTLGDVTNNGIRKAFIGKTHFSFDNINPQTPTGLMFQTMNLTTDIPAGRFGDWDYRCTVVNNHNNLPVPDPNSAGPQPAGVGVSPGAAARGSYYCYRLKKTDQEENVGNTQSVGGDATAEGSDGQFSTSRYVDEAIEFWKTVDPKRERGFLLFTPNATHAPFNRAPRALMRTPLYIEDSLTTVFRRELGCLETLDRELQRLWNHMPYEIRSETTIILCTDNGLDDPWVTSMLGLGTTPEPVAKDPGAHIVLSNTQGRTKGSVYRYGIGAQMFAYGPGIPHETCDALINAPCDMYNTICAYFGRTPGANSQGISFANTWAGGVTLATHTRNSLYQAYFWPNGRPDPDDQPEFTQRDTWNIATTYADGAVVWWNSSHWQNTTTGTTGNEPSNSSTTWTADTGGQALANLDVIYMRYTPTALAAGETGAVGLLNLVRRLYPTGTTPGSTNNADTTSPLQGDRLYRTHGVNGAVIDEYQQTVLDKTLTSLDGTYAVLVTEMEAIQGTA